MKNITFSKTLDVSEKYNPIPAYKNIPNWYKKTSTYISNKKDVSVFGTTTGTIKKCIPVFDALTSGYIIVTYCDLLIKKNEKGEVLYLTSGDINLEFHPISQAPYHPYMNDHDYPKWLNPWAIETPKGYSCLFIPPVHGGNNFFSVAEGVVDTDNYAGPINFPFVLNDVDFEGLIPAGTPIVQVIPFKREKWKMSMGSDKNLKKIKDNHLFLRSKFYDRYKTMFWNRKEYK